MLASSNVGDEAEGGAEGDYITTCPTLSLGIDLHLDGDSENHGDRRRLTVLVHQWNRPVGLAEDM